MGRPYHGPRLYLRTGPDRTPIWFMRDKGMRVSLGYREHERDLAETHLEQYAKNKAVQAAPPAPIGTHINATVYFASCEVPDFPVKIGVANNLRARRGTLQTSLPWPVLILATRPGGWAEERLLHERYREYRMQGEWFRRNPRLLEEIEKCKSE